VKFEKAPSETAKIFDLNSVRLFEIAKIYSDVKCTVIVVPGHGNDARSKKSISVFRTL